MPRIGCSNDTRIGPEAAALSALGSAYACSHDQAAAHPRYNAGVYGAVTAKSPTESNPTDQHQLVTVAHARCPRRVNGVHEGPPEYLMAWALRNILGSGLEHAQRHNSTLAQPLFQ